MHDRLTVFHYPIKALQLFDSMLSTTTFTPGKDDFVILPIQGPIVRLFYLFKWSAVSGRLARLGSADFVRDLIHGNITALKDVSLHGVGNRCE